MIALLPSLKQLKMYIDSQVMMFLRGLQHGAFCCKIADNVPGMPCHPGVAPSLSVRSTVLGSMVCVSVLSAQRAFNPASLSFLCLP